MRSVGDSCENLQILLGPRRFQSCRSGRRVSLARALFGDLVYSSRHVRRMKFQLSWGLCRAKILDNCTFRVVVAYRYGK
jgi:hypothetical protein